MSTPQSRFGPTLYTEPSYSPAMYVPAFDTAIGRSLQVPVYECQRCSALVRDTDVHSAHHAQLHRQACRT